MSIKVGDKVTWYSGANGTYIEKTGKVVEVVKPGRRPDIARYKTLGNTGPGRSRTHESYVVAVKKPKSYKLYWPRVSALRVIGGES